MRVTHLFIYSALESHQNIDFSRNNLYLTGLFYFIFLDSTPYTVQSGLVTNIVEIATRQIFTVAQHYLLYLYSTEHFLRSEVFAAVVKSRLGG